MRNPILPSLLATVVVLSASGCQFRMGAPGSSPSTALATPAPSPSPSPRPTDADGTSGGKAPMPPKKGHPDQSEQKDAKYPAPPLPPSKAKPQPKPLPKDDGWANWDKGKGKGMPQQKPMPMPMPPDSDPSQNDGSGDGYDDDYDDYGPDALAGRIAGEPCHGASRGNICLGLKYVVYQDPAGDPVELGRDAMDNVREVNHLWRECGIEFQIDRYVPVEPEQERLRYRTADHAELNEIRRKFMDERTLLVVITGPWNRRGSLGATGANAWTNLPGEQWLGSILERPVAASPEVLAHELGHYLSLDHVSDASSLMNPVVYRDSTRLTRPQCESARWAARYFWKKMIRRNR